MDISERGLLLIEGFEGFSSVRYLDSVGVPTIGYGTTAADVNPVPATCTRAQAEGWLRSFVERVYEVPVKALGTLVNQNQFDALVSLAYNVGPGVIGWAVGPHIRERRYDLAANDFMRYVYGQGGVYLQGLYNRRLIERHLFLTPFVPPPPPDPALLFPDRSFNFYGNHVNERLTYRQIKGALKHPQKYHNYLKGPLRQRAKWLRDRCKRVAFMSHPHAWSDSRHLGERWQKWNSLMAAIDKL